MSETNKKYTYFASDFHLGAPNDAESLQREKEIVAWLTSIESSANCIYLVGDIFDFWFEYKHVIPKGFSRLQGKIAALTDNGIAVHFFYGNHDMWMFEYFKKELGVEIHSDDIQVSIGSKKLFIAHGDGLGKGDKGYKFIKKIFRSSFCQWIFARLHPNFGFSAANFFSKTSRSKNGPRDKQFNGIENEWLYNYSKELNIKNNFDYFIYGHRHLPLKIPFDNSVYFNLGEWITYQTFGKFDGENFELLQWKNGKEQPYKTLAENDV
jgi:UDP-2,3-diacylglucosamine hydrolase